MALVPSSQSPSSMAWDDGKREGGESGLKTLQANSEMNPNLCVLVQELRWGDHDQAQLVAEYGPFIHIVGSDILYDPRVWPGLLASLKELASADTEVLIAYPERGGEEEFLPMAVRHGFKAAEVHRDGMYAVVQMSRLPHCPAANTEGHGKLL